MDPNRRNVISKFHGFEAAHGPMKDPLTRAADPAAAVVMWFLMDAMETSRHPGGGKTTAEAVRIAMKYRALDILQVAELAVRWTSDPLEAAREDLREEIEQRQAEEAQERQAREERFLRDRVAARAEELIATLRPCGTDGLVS